MSHVLAYSGAADKIGFHFGFAYRRWIENDLDPLGIVGTSSGAIVAFVEMCGNMEKAREIAMTYNVKDNILGFEPFSKKGIAIASWNTVTGRQDGFWKFKNLEKTIRQITDPFEYRTYNGPDVFVGITNKFGQIDYRKLDNNKMTYEQAIKNVIASCSIPGVIKSVNGETDGGVVDHIGSNFLMDRHPDADVVSVFAREDKIFNKEKSKRIIGTHLWNIDRMMHEISINDELLADSGCIINNTKHHKVFMKENPVKGLFKLKKEDNKKLFDMGFNAVQYG